MQELKYDAEQHPLLLRKLIGEGKTFVDIAQLFGVTNTTLSQWRKDYTAMAVAVKLGRDDQDTRVERALFERATGYSHDSVKIVTVSDGMGKGSSIEQVPFVEHYPPDPQSLKFWLTNRRAKEWKDKSEIEVTNRAERLQRARERRQRPDKPQE